MSVNYAAQDLATASVYTVDRLHYLASRILEVTSLDHDCAEDRAFAHASLVSATLSALSDEFRTMAEDLEMVIADYNWANTPLPF